ncbi:MAG: methionyl-tRNA formyltransferase [Lentisphaeria bacterium]|nr:methionyl-tRNA formyltransferase [Lentisphaeria bacterium]
MIEPLKIVFLGSGPIAVPILRVLAQSPEIDLQAVVSQLDRPAGRKRILTPTPLAAAALDMGLEVLRVADVNTPEFISYLSDIAPDLICVVSFGQILKSPLLAVPRICCVNVHASLLPRYRGASPIVQAILNGDGESGVCFMQMERGLDSGPVFRELRLELDHTEYADSLENELGELAAAHAVRTLQDIAGGKLAAAIQDPAAATVCRKIAKRDGMIDWHFPAERIEAMTRAYFPWPGAAASFRNAAGKESALTICAARCLSGYELPAGCCADLPGRLVVGCGCGEALEILELIPSGGKRMSAAAFRNGMRGELPEFITEAEI